MIARACLLGVALALLTGHVHAQPAPEPSPPPSPAPAPADPVATAIAQTFEPTTRAAGIAELERLWASAPDRRGARRALARALSWEQRLDEALGHYDELVREHSPPDQELVLERLAALSWKGRVAEAEAGYAALAAEHPDLAAAQVGLARMRRWRGASLAALGAAQRAVARAPTDGPAREELASSLLALGLPAAAVAAVAGDPPPSAALRAQLDRARRPELSTAVTAMSDSFGIERLAPRAKATLRLVHDLRLEVGGGSSHLRTASETLDYGVGAVAVSLALPWLEVGGGAAVYGGAGLLLSEGSAYATFRAHDRLRLTIGTRRRPFLEVAEPLATGEAAFFAAGAGGATTLVGVARRGVDELRLALNGAPWTGVFAYADARGLLLSDGNAGYTVAAGAGADLLALLGDDLPIALMARADSIALGFRDARLDYFSPAQFDAHVLGGQLLLRLGPLRASAYGGATFTLDQAGGIGWTAGTSLELTLDRVAISARAERRDDIAYAVQRGWLSLVIAL